MKRVIIAFIALVFMIIFSCDEKIFFVKCGDCVADEPLETDLEVNLDLLIGGTQVTARIDIYEGNIEDSIIVLKSFPVSDRSWQYTVLLNKKYTLSATYVTNKGTFVAIDSATPRVRYVTDQCDNPCYYVYDKKVNLNIKYTK